MNGRFRSRQGLGAFRRRAGGVLRTPSRRTAYTAGVRGRGTGRRMKTKFAMAGYARDVEKKYMDKALCAINLRAVVTGIANPSTYGGFSWATYQWNPYDFDTPPGTTAIVTNNLIRGLDQGSTATTRVGNKVTCKYIKGAITLTGAKIVGPSVGSTNGDMNGEALATASNATSLYQFLRTTFRVVIVKDLQVNSADTQIEWNDVFETGVSAVGETGGVHSELKIANMGRFRILSDKMVSTEASRPQITLPFTIPGSSVGQIRYNGPTGTSLTDQGIYVIMAAYTNGATVGASATDGLVTPALTMHSRLCFTDS